MDTKPIIRAKHYHGGSKGRIVGNNVKPAPAWRESATNEAGSKVLLSNLPVDVSETEITDLMKKVIGPVVLNKSYMFHNVKGYPLGMALVAFKRNGDAALAREKFNGKVIDGKRSIKLELVIDEDLHKTTILTQPPKPKSLFDRISTPNSVPNKQANSTVTIKPVPPAARRPPPPQPVHHQAVNLPTGPRENAAALARRRKRKGPRRIKKKPLTVADLDKDMEDYIAGRGPI